MSKLIPYLGGKRLLAKSIIPLFPEHSLYCEPFGGSGTILLEKDPSEREILNDINNEVITLFRVVQNHLDEFIKHIRWFLLSRQEFNRFKSLNNDVLTDIQKAVRFYYLMKAGYAGKVSSPHLGISIKGGGGKDKPVSIYRIEESLYEIHRRLEAVVFESLPFEQIFTRYDSPGTVFYIDPPYHGHEKDYGKNIFARSDFAKLRKTLDSLSGKFLLSINDTSETREIFKGFNILPVSLNYSAGSASNGGKKALELLIANYPLKH